MEPPGFGNNSWAHSGLPDGCDALARSRSFWGGKRSFKAHSIIFKWGRPDQVPCRISCFEQMAPNVLKSSTSLEHFGPERKGASFGQAKKRLEKGCSITHCISRNSTRGSNQTLTNSATALPVSTVMHPA